jgi:hypothetical protein
MIYRINCECACLNYMQQLFCICDQTNIDVKYMCVNSDMYLLMYDMQHHSIHILNGLYLIDI